MQDKPVFDSDEFPIEELAPAIDADDPEADLHTDPDAPDPGAIVLEGPPLPWRVAEALKRLRAQVNELAPRRSKTSDGSVGDAAHQSRSSDHNPHIRDAGVGVVSAIDITHDPAGGCDAHRIAASLVSNRDARIKYIIWNKRIVASYPAGGSAAWVWRPYSGRNGHTHHVHISVLADKPNYDSARDWSVSVA